MENEILKVAYAEGCRVALIDAGYDVKTAESMSADLVEKMAPVEKQAQYSSYIPGMAAAADPFVLGPIAGGATAPEGEGWRRALGTAVGGIGGGIGAEAIAHRLSSNPKLQLLLTLLGAGAGGQLGANIAGKE
jgi:outer membrane lipoprotein SlyB